MTTRVRISLSAMVITHTTYGKITGAPQRITPKDKILSGGSLDKWVERAAKELDEYFSNPKNDTWLAD